MKTTLPALAGVLLLAPGCGGPPPAAPAPAPASPADTAAASTGASLPDLGGRKVLVGTDATYPPFESVDVTTDRIVGFDPDLLAEIARLIHIEPELQNADFSTIFAALQAGQFDLVMSAATITEERKQVVAFSAPYVTVGQRVVTRAGDGRIRSYLDLAQGAIVGVQTGTTGEQAAAATARVEQARLRRYQTIDLAFADLANGTIDAIVADSPTVGNYVGQDRYRERVQIVGEPFTTESYGIAARKSDAALLAAIDLALARLAGDGAIRRLQEKHGIR